MKLEWCEFERSHGGRFWLTVACALAVVVSGCAGRGKPSDSATASDPPKTPPTTAGVTAMERPSPLVLEWLWLWPGSANAPVIVADDLGSAVVVAAGAVRKYDEGCFESWKAYRDYRLETPTIVTVTTDGPISYGGGTVRAPLMDGTRAYLSSFDVSGNETWRTVFGTAGRDRVCSIAFESGFLYVAGDSTPMGPRGNVLGSPKAYLRKFDTTGKEIWARSLGPGQVPTGHGLAANGDGVYVVVTELASGSTDQARLKGFDEDGNCRWTRDLPSSGSAPFHVAAGPGQVYVAGYSPSLSATSPGYLRSFDNQGNELWTRSVNQTALDSVAAGTSGVYVAFSTWSWNPESNGGLDVAVRGYDRDGNQLWTTQIGTKDDDHHIDMSVEIGEIFVVAGISKGSREPWSSDTYEYFIAKLSLDGTL